jgi:hypothetical protein
MALMSGPRKRFLLATLVTGLLGVAATIAGADLMHSVLVTGLQLWRTHWILHWVAVGMLPFTLYELWQRAGTGRATAALLAVAFVSTRFPGSTGAMLLAIAIHLGARRGFKLGAGAQSVLLLVCVLTAGAAIAHEIGLRLFGNDVPAEQAAWSLAARALGHPFMAVLATGGLLLALRSTRLRPLAVCCAVALAALAVAAWDQRSAWTRFVEDRAGGDVPFAGLIRPDQHVLWHGELLATWLVLSRPSWYSPSQGTGVLFNRKNALEYERRQSVVSVLEAQEDTCRMLAGFFSGPGDCSPDLEALQGACRQAGDLDFIIIRSGMDGSASAVWTFAGTQAQSEAGFHLYDCKRLAGG